MNLVSSFPWWITLPVVAAASILATIFVVSLYRAFLIVSAAAWERSLLLIAQLTESIVRALFAMARGCGALLRAGGYLLTWPFSAGWKRVVEPGWEALMVKVEQRRQREEL